MCSLECFNECTIWPVYSAEYNLLVLFLLVAINLFTADPVKALHFAILVLSARAPECQKLKMVG